MAVSHVSPATPLRQTLRALVALAIVLAVAGTAWFLANLRTERIRHAQLRAEAGAQLLEEHVLRSFRSTEFVLDQLADLARERPQADFTTWTTLQRLINGLPEPGTLWIADAAGNVILGSLTFPPVPSNLMDRYYFTAHLAERQNLVVGPLVNTKSRGLQAFHLSKRVEDEAGNFLGVVAAGADAQYYTDFYHSLALGPGSNVAIVDLKGRVIFRQPDPDKWVDKNIAGGPVMAALAMAPSGVARGVSPLDGTERMVAYRLVEAYGVVVLCGIALPDALAPWYDAMAVATLVMALVIVVLSTVAALAFRSLRREEQVMAGLEDSIRERTAEAEFQAAEARRANETKTRFLAAASHDLRQPLQAAGMFVEALAARLGESPHMAVVDKLRQSIDATQTLLSTLLDASTLEAGRVQANPVAFPLLPMMASLMDQLEPEASARGLSLHVVPTEAWVVSDPVLLERMIRNLMVNALRYTESGGVLMGCRRRGDQLAIQVVDTGTGIPADKIATVFEDFTRLSDKGKGPTRGLGLGLGVVRRMATLLGHELELRSVPGKGSTFGVVVPVARWPERVKAGAHETETAD